MGLLQRIGKAFGGTQATQLTPAMAKAASAVAGQVFGDPAAKEDAHGILASIFPFGQPPRRGTREMMLLYGASPWMRAVLGDIASGVGATQWRVYAVKTAASRQLPAGQRSLKRQKLQLADAGTRRKLMAAHAQAGELDEIEDHPLLDLLAKGNRLMDGAAAMTLSQLYDDMKGDTFLLIERDAQGVPVELWPVPPYWVMETPSIQRPSFRVQFGGWNQVIPETEMIWKRDHDPYNPYARGIGRGEALSDELETDEYASKHLKSWFYNNGLPATIVSMEGGGPEEAKRLKEEWRQQYEGFWKSFRLHFTSRKIDVKQLSMSFADQQLMELRTQQRDVILETFSYPKELLGILDNANRSTIDTASYRREKYVIEPRREAWRRMLQQRLVPEFDDRIVLDYVSTVPEDREFVLKVMQARPSAFSENEARELANHAPLPVGGDARPPLVQAPPMGGFALAARPARSKGKRIKATGESDDEEGGWTAADFDQVVAAVKREVLTASVKGMYEPELQAFVEKAMKDAGLSVDFAALNPVFLAHVKEVAVDRMQLVTDSTKASLRGAIAAGVEADEGIADIAARIKAVPGFEDDSERAELIARTEVTRSSNYGQMEAWKSTGVVDTRVWIATADGRTRDSHRALNGQEQPMDKPFSISGESAMYPGGFGDPSQDCNCRCTVGAVISDPELAASARTKAGADADLGERWKRYAAAVTPWEVAMTRAVQAGLDQQRAAVVKALEDVRRK